MHFHSSVLGRLLFLLALLAAGCTGDAPVGPEPTLNSLPADSLTPIEASELDSTVVADSTLAPDEKLAPETDLTPESGLAPGGGMAPSQSMTP